MADGPPQRPLVVSVYSKAIHSLIPSTQSSKKKINENPADDPLPVIVPVFAIISCEESVNLIYLYAL